MRTEPALLSGAHRSLSIYSYHYRGTETQPGLVFGLVRGGSCRGMAFEVRNSDWDGVLGYLRERELVTDVYRETYRPIRLASGHVTRALTYVVDERHVQYAGKLALPEQARLVRASVGHSGPNIDYVLNTARRLAQLGIRDRTLAELAELLEARLD